MLLKRNYMQRIYHLQMIDFIKHELFCLRIQLVPRYHLAGEQLHVDRFWTHF